ncbi:hypothetical protein N9U83_06100 [Candidatus Pelagibacter sp.]|nr:hypothetical protein [Candidatus Pelagibacter sp.]
MKIIQTMPCRVSAYDSIVKGFEKTKIHLISYDDKCSGGSDIISLGGHTDYIGSYFFVPNISRIFNLDINLATNLFFATYGLLCVIISLLTINSINGTNKYKIIASSTVICLGLLFISISDTYSFYGLTSLALLPFWDNYLIKNKSVSIFNLITFSLFTGFVIAVSNSVRGFSGTFILLPIVFLMLTFDLKKNFKIRILLIALILFPILLINNFFDNLVKKRDFYFHENPKLKTILNENGIYLNNSRAVWHNAFYNLAYIKDDKIMLPEKSDVGSVQWARKIDPNIKLFTKEYEELLKNEYFKFIKKNTAFFIKIIFFKISIILIYFILFFNYGFYFLFKNYNNRKQIYLYSSGLILFSTIGIATEPLYTYMLGFFTFSSLFSVSLIYKKNK